MLKEFPLKQTKITDRFWSYYLELISKTIIPYQYQVMNDELDINVEAERKDASLPAGKSHALENFRIAAGLTQGEHFGWFFQDSDVYKWLEAVGYSLEIYPDDELESLADEVIELIGKAQESDGYLDTFFQLTRPELKYRQLYFSHELYCAGHLIEAAIAYHQATGKGQLLDIAKKWIINIQKHFGYEDGKIQGADGHQEIELALVRLYEYTGDLQYLELADFFIDVRGKDPDFYLKEVEENVRLGLSAETPLVDLKYLQAYTQPINQKFAEGHAVRMLYMATGMAKVAGQTGNKGLLKACKVIWENITQKRMYITGGVGSTVQGEAFTGDYDLPNDTMYCETCAAIALVYFAYELFKIEPKPEYMEIIERALYNGVLSGASVDGKHFFYVNPLEVHPDTCDFNPGKGHVKPIRPDWLGCACCPPNFARTIGSIERYIYTCSKNSVYVNLLIGSELQTDEYRIKQLTEFPYENQVMYNIRGNRGNKVYLRKPSWANAVKVETEVNVKESESYFIVECDGENQQIKLVFEQPIQLIKGNPLIRSAHGKTAVQRGPFIYCMEETDNEANLHLYQLTDSKAKINFTDKVLSQTITLNMCGRKEKLWETDVLYQKDESADFEEKELTLIPYHLWGNRGRNEMSVWLNLKE